MKQTMKRSLAMFIVVVMFIALVPAFNLSVSAADDFYTYSSQGYIYNWGTRGTTATFLSPNAEKFYEDNNTSYDELSAYLGSDSVSAVPNSQLFKVLQELMASNHSYKTSYEATKELYQYTDCQNGGGMISSFYSGVSIGPAWGEGGSWNREHTWPNSKGLGGQDENDIMMLRPTSTSENSSRGNTAYGQSSNYYDPNDESNGKYNLHGDVARIFLYVYVRWGNRNYAWGTSGVMENVDVLLAWMEEDPVDTWELGRNDAVESITGTRNVFVDYPELAFILFDEEIPADMATPSGAAQGAGQKCGHNNFDAGVVTAPTCTQRGYMLYTCLTSGCGYSYKDTYIDAKGHSYSNDVCSVCGETKPLVPTYVTSVEVGKTYKLGLLASTEFYFTGSIVNKYYGGTDSDYQKGIDVFLEQATGGYYLYFKDSSGQKTYINLIASGTYRNFTISSTATSVFTWDTSKNTLTTKVEGEVCYIGNYGSYTSMNVLTSSNYKEGDYLAHLYTMGSGSSDTPTTPPVDTPTCQHAYTSTVIAPTCTAGGFTTYTCTLCGDSYTDNQTSAKGHSYTNGTCASCGATQPAAGTATTATISFTSTANRTEFSGSKQVWVQNGITVTNVQASSQNPVADYSNPIRCYAGSNVTISYPGMTKIEIDCTSLAARYVDSWTSVTNATATNNNGIVTVVFDSPVDSFTYTGLSAQSRAYSITVYSGDSQSQPSTPPQQCTHTNTIIVGATSATCTTNGYSGNTVCQQCNAILSQGEIIAAGHIDANNDKICDVCGAQPGGTNTDTPDVDNPGTNTPDVDNPGTDTPDANGHVYAAWVVIRVPTCTVAGLERRDCDHCSDYETRETPALGHTDADENGICDTCEAEMKDQVEATPDDAVVEDNAEHTCEEVSGWKKFWNSIMNFFRKLFGQPELCDCGKEIKKED